MRRCGAQIKEAVEELRRMQRNLNVPGGVGELVTLMGKFLAWAQKTSSNLRRCRLTPVALRCRCA